MKYDNYSTPGEFADTLVKSAGFTVTCPPCIEFKNRMNEWGWTGCWKRRREITDWFVRQAKANDINLKSDDAYGLVREGLYRIIFQRSKTSKANSMNALLTAERVSLEIFVERVSICEKCEYRRTDSSGDWCGICGCSVSSNTKMIRNLAAYEERLPQWGCKYPDKSKGGWKR